MKAQPYGPCEECGAEEVIIDPTRLVKQCSACLHEERVGEMERCPLDGGRMRSGGSNTVLWSASGRCHTLYCDSCDYRVVIMSKVVRRSPGRFQRNRGLVDALKDLQEQERA